MTPSKKSEAMKIDKFQETFESQALEAGFTQEQAIFLSNYAHNIILSVVKTILK
jgi:hypothetical protein